MEKVLSKMSQKQSYKRRRGSKFEHLAAGASGMPQQQYLQHWDRHTLQGLR